ncbi:hypothetical protein BDY24DRAFT_444573 [Mrakia frigida]|uniref:uncharacterized protein n=1 Tax=Mrakia frigida TaxID=29902 RepID=UPI003FCC0102
MTNSSLPSVGSSAVLPPTLLTAYSDSEAARISEVAAFETYRASMRAHHQPMSIAAQGLVLQAQSNAEQVKLDQLTANLALQ